MSPAHCARPEGPEGTLGGLGVLVVLVVEDEPVVAAAHCHHVDAVPGFRALEPALTAADALRRLGGEQGREVDLVLLDMNLPDRHGLEVVRALRAMGRTTDVLAVTGARELSLVRAATALGVVGYLLKPFAGGALRERLQQYATYRADLRAAGPALSQADVDRAVRARPITAHPITAHGTAAAGGATGVPKGLTPSILVAVADALRDGPASAAEVGARFGISRVTARRYLEHLVASGAATREPRYGTTGRPELEYRRRGPGSPVVP